MNKKERNMNFIGRFAGEFVGTFTFLGTIFCVVEQKVDAAPLPIAMALLVSAYGLGGVTGGHFNPAVSLLDFTSSKLGFWGEEAKPEQHITTLPMLLTYWTAQFSGGLLAGTVMHSILSSKSPPALLPGA
jgi:glycerol uptake facilitator-like aquaporin